MPPRLLVPFSPRRPSNFNPRLPANAEAKSMKKSFIFQKFDYENVGQKSDLKKVAVALSNGFLFTRRDILRTDEKVNISSRLIGRLSIRLASCPGCILRL